MIDYTELLASMADTKLAPWKTLLPQQIAAGLDEQRHGDLPRWRAALEQLPKVQSSEIELSNSVSIGADEDTSEASKEEIRKQLRALIPWRKGPYHVHGTDIDTEWHSDWKWNRVLPHLAPLKGRTILDVGCGNGYHCWRMYGEGASRVIGIDPSPRFVVQFYSIKHFIGPAPVDVLPVGIEAVPANLQAFDTVFSMGVLYHRRSPMDHLKELKATLRPGGQLVLETLVIEGVLGEALVPEGRYCMMNNVWFLPSCETLLSWLKKCGYKNPRVVDVNTTTVKEQRATDWMHFHSLSDFLDSENPNLSAEGHPAPIRAVILAEAPE